MKRTIMVMAGGTGGHVYPGMAVADHLAARGWSVVWLGSKGGMEQRLIAGKDYAAAWLSIAGVRGKGPLRLALLPAMLLLAMVQAARALFRHRPDVVLGMGGFAAFPGGVMAALFNRPLVVHEQNSVAGLTNRLLACLADRVLVGFPTAFARRRPGWQALCGGIAAEWTGNPVRADIAALAPPAERGRGRAGPLRLLVVGGSLGAKALNDTLPQALARLPETERPQVTHQSGVRHADALRAAYAAAGVEAEVLPFIDDMAARYAAADLLICRAGALTVAELAAAGVAAVLVPFPHAVDDHQTGNARFLADAGAALLLPQADLTPHKLAQLLAGLDRPALARMAQAARALGKPDATARVAGVCAELAGDKA